MYAITMAYHEAIIVSLHREADTERRARELARSRGKPDQRRNRSAPLRGASMTRNHARSSMEVGVGAR